MPRGRLRNVVGWSVVLFWTAMFVGTHIPLPELKQAPDHFDKFLHFSAYAGLSFLLGWWRALSRDMTFRRYVAVFAVMFLYSIMDELLQMIPVLNRTGDVYDALADWCGSVLGLLILYVLLVCWKRGSEP